MSKVYEIFKVELSAREAMIALDAVLHWRSIGKIEPFWRFLGDSLIRKLASIDTSTLETPTEKAREEAEPSGDESTPQTPTTTNADEFAHDPAEYRVQVRFAANDPWEQSGGFLSTWREAHEALRENPAERKRVVRNNVRARFTGRGRFLRCHILDAGKVVFVK